MFREGFAGVTPIEEFLEEYLPASLHERSAKITRIVKTCRDTLKASIAALDDATDMSRPLINHLQQVVSGFPESNKPIIADTRNFRFTSLDEGGRYTTPDITASRPRITSAPVKWDWPQAGTVVELKYKTDFFEPDGSLKTSEESRKNLRELAKSARSLLVGSGSCVVYVVSVFARRMARIFRFDRAGFRASSAFDWTKDTRVFPKFFLRLYNPVKPNTDMCGADDTRSIPTPAEKRDMYSALCRHSFYQQHFSLSDATDASLWIRGVRFRTDANNEVVSEPVKCFTIGPALSSSDGLFDRATLVYRVILAEDVGSKSPTIYVLKDSWRQRCRRPEVDFYDVIAKHCELNKIDMDGIGMAKCHGSVDLSIVTSGLVPGHDPAFHSTCSKIDNADLERCHMRTLLTPVGVPLNTFKSSKDFARALLTAIEHHEIANAAGVLHRDVSEGNVLLQETCNTVGTSKAFLVDWDYAEFTPTGLHNFNKWFPDREEATKGYESIEKSLKDLTGTQPFLAIELMEEPTVRHEAHHDLESFYWLFLWCIFRYTAHTHYKGPHACRTVFGPSYSLYKRGTLWQRPIPISKALHLPLFHLASGLAVAVATQNAPEPSKYQPTQERKPIEYADFINIFREELDLPGWQKDDAALVYSSPPSVSDLWMAKESEATSQAKQSLRQTAIERSTKRSGKRTLDEAETAGGSGPARKKCKTASAGTVEVLRRRAARSGGAASAKKTGRGRAGSGRNAGPRKKPNGKRGPGSGGN
ncbi:hypothetical protein B0H15DRAFT_927750 [Mycena belliarum]|uniref:Fungal-type protein kinase domain-containing protein n=1 Tax=Mycena belliarum TaxID=1033014 RepID=A0AAD6UF86_9AGAR|nr:hypothetical protein B0H15DRAFT_927750 [Mycena belliae]